LYTDLPIFASDSTHPHLPRSFSVNKTIYLPGSTGPPPSPPPPGCLFFPINIWSVLVHSTTSERSPPPPLPLWKRSPCLLPVQTLSTDDSRPLCFPICKIRLWRQRPHFLLIKLQGSHSPGVSSDGLKELRAFCAFVLLKRTSEYPVIPLSLNSPPKCSPRPIYSILPIQLSVALFFFSPFFPFSPVPFPLWQSPDATSLHFSPSCAQPPPPDYLRLSFARHVKLAVFPPSSPLFLHC